MSKPRPPTPAQRRLLLSVQQDQGPRRVCFRSERPSRRGTIVSYNYRWVASDGREVPYATVYKCTGAGWLEEVQGGLKPGCPEGLDALWIAMGNWREPNTLRLTDAGRAVL